MLKLLESLSGWGSASENRAKVSQYLTERHQSLLSIANNNRKTIQLCEKFPSCVPFSSSFKIPSHQQFRSHSCCFCTCQTPKASASRCMYAFKSSGATAPSNLICFQPPSYPSQVSASNPCFIQPHSPGGVQLCSSQDDCV